MLAFLRDLRHAARALSGSLGYTIAAVATMAVGVGATAAMFSIVNPVLIEPLPFPAADHLIAVGGVREDAPGELRGTSLVELRDWREQSRSIEAFAAWRDWGMSRHDGVDGEGVYGAIVTPQIFQVFPVQPRLGRLFHPDDDQPGRNQVVLLTDGYWRERFGADRNVIGRTMVLERGPRATYTIVGVLPPQINELPSFEDVQLFALSSSDPDAGLGRDLRNRRVFARLRRGRTIDDAAREMEVIAARLAREYPETNAIWSIAVRPLVVEEVGSVGNALRALFAAVGFVLLIACANVAALQLARALARRREFSIRQAIGGRRLDLARALVAEGLLVSAAGGAAGLILAGWLVDAMLSAGPAIPRAGGASVDLAVVAFAIAACSLAGLLVALPASLLTTRLDVVRGLKEESGHVPNVRAHRWRLAFVGAQVALALALLTGAVLAGQTFVALLTMHPGFRPDGVATISVFAPIEKKGQEVTGLYARAIEEIRALPGVTSASAVSTFPLLRSSESIELRVEGGDRQPARYFNVAPGYFDTLGAPLRRGRDFTADDRAGGTPVAVVNEAFVRRYLAGREPIGARVRRTGGDGEVLTIVGVFGDLLQELRRGTAVEPEIYFPYAQAPRWATFIVVRAVDPGVTLPIATQRIRSLDPELRVGTPGLMTDRIAQWMRAPRFTLLLLGTFAGVAVLLSAIGVYGLVSYTVAQRTREIGLRISLGAQRRDILRLLARSGLAAVAAGSAVGLIGTVAVSRLAAAALPQVDPLRPGAVVLAWALLVIVGAVACYVPARRALRIDPIVALRVP
ncbi:MAG TPA: ABC transporter permease [Vicinamibacterales bacterium]|nr:ABC transporter permease [Vicinamibacterales bacterium]